VSLGNCLILNNNWLTKYDSVRLGGLPLAHEQAAAYCERLEISLADYRRRFETTPARLLDSERDAPADYHDRLTVAKTFALAIDEAAKLHAAAEPLIVHAALLAPEPIPLFLFAAARSRPLPGNARGRFMPGTSGNPSGRPRGSLNRRTLATLAGIEAARGEAPSTPCSG
jgi:hypothetical protein